MPVDVAECQCGRTFDLYQSDVNGKSRTVQFCWSCDGHRGGDPNRPEAKANCEFKGSAVWNCTCRAGHNH